MYTTIGFSSNFGCLKYGERLFFFHITFRITPLYKKIFLISIRPKMQHLNKMLHFLARRPPLRGTVALPAGPTAGGLWKMTWLTRNAQYLPRFEFWSIDL